MTYHDSATIRELGVVRPTPPRMERSPVEVKDLPKERSALMSLRDLRPQRVRRSPADLVAHMQRFTLVPKFSVGILYFSPFAGRFHDRYAPEVPIEARVGAGARPPPAGGGARVAPYPG